MKKQILTLLLLVSFSLSVFGQSSTKANSPARKAAENITKEQLSDYLHFIASDEMEGRDTPSRGLDATAKFMATLLSRWSVKPAGDNGTFFQKMFVIRKMTEQSETSLEINGQKLVYGEDYFAEPNAIKTEAPLVFGGHGWFHKAKGIDALANIDVKGKILVVYSNGLPKGLAFQDFDEGEIGKDWADPAIYAKMKGAVGLISIASPRMQTNWALSRQQRERSGIIIEKLRGEVGERIPTVFLNQKIVNTWFEGEAGNPITNADLNAFEFKNAKNAKFTISSKIDRTPTQNVVGMIEGSDDILKQETVVLTAHYDHDGVRPNAPDEDKIWNGADDDGSGTVALLAMAEALAKSPKKPKRSTVFLWVAGEEKGLLGSEYFTKFPTIPFDKITANINIDMIGRSRKPDNTDNRDKNLSGENEVYVIGSKMMSSTLGEVTEKVNEKYLNLSYNYKYDDPKDTNRFFFRSDHFNFAVRGVPAVFFFNGVHRDYHQAGDHADKIDYVRMEKITRTIFMTLWELSDLKERPKVDRELPKELRQR